MEYIFIPLTVQFGELHHIGWILGSLDCTNPHYLFWLHMAQGCGGLYGFLIARRSFVFSRYSGLTVQKCEWVRLIRHSKLESINCLLCRVPPTPLLCHMTAGIGSSPCMTLKLDGWIGPWRMNYMFSQFMKAALLWPTFHTRYLKF